MVTKDHQTLKKILGKFQFGLRTKLISLFLLVTILPLLALAGIAWWQIDKQGVLLRNIAVRDSTSALNDMAVKELESMSLDTAMKVADFLYDRDSDALYMGHLEPTEDNYHVFLEYSTRNVIDPGRWLLNATDTAWIPATVPPKPQAITQSANKENNDMNSFWHRPPDNRDYQKIPLYDEITFIDLNGQEIIKVHPKKSTKIHHPLDPTKKDVSQKENTYIKAENYFEKIKDLQHGEIYVSDVIGAYVKTNYIGLYTPENIAQAIGEMGHEIEYAPEDQAYSIDKNPTGRQFEGLIRWATPVVNHDGEKTGYVTLALNHDHLLWLVTQIAPANRQSTDTPSVDYPQIWDYKARNIVNPRHHSIVGYNPETGDPEVPWLEESIYQGWKNSDVEKWTEYVQNYPPFHEQSRSKNPSADLTRQGLVGLDGRYLNHAPQTQDWMNLTQNGGSGSFYILWSGLYKISATATIPYYTGPYAPSAANGYSKRGFGFVTINSDLNLFTSPARQTEKKLVAAISKNLGSTVLQLCSATIILAALVIIIASGAASYLTNHITYLIDGMTRFQSGERQFRFKTSMGNELASLAESFNAMADSIVASVKSPLSILDMDKKVIYMNEWGLQMINKSLDQVVGQNYSKVSLYPHNTRYSPLTALAENGEAAVTYFPKSKRYIKPEAIMMLNSQGEAIAYIIESHDITEMITRQKAMEKAIKVANQANTHKGDFLARMSHEIRTPMNAIIGLSQIVKQYLNTIDIHTQEAQEAKDHMYQVEISSQHLLGLLNDILDVSKIEAGKISLTRENFKLQELIETVSSIIKPRCVEKNHTFNILFDTFKSDTFLSDPLRLRQILINLLANAVKFTPDKGTIELHVKNLGSQDGLTHVHFIVTDTGIGISKKALTSIFHPFEQATSNTSNQYGGTGLGLTISNHIVQIFGGEIKVESTQGQGSKFEFALWLQEVTSVKSNRPTNNEDTANKLLGQRVLLVDDVDLNRIVVKAMLKPTGITIDEAADGQEALEIFKNSPAKTYDIIFMDVQMPKLDGYQATKAIRALDHPDAATVPIIALTANAFTEDTEKASQAGMNDHLAKPVKIDTLLDIVFRYLLP